MQDVNTILIKMKILRNLLIIFFNMFHNNFFNN